MFAYGVRSCISIVLLTLLASTALASGAVVYEGDFVPSSMVWEQDEYGRSFPVLGDLRTLAEPGQPRLPVWDLTLLVPLGSDVVRAWIEPLNTHRERLTEAVALGDPLVADNGDLINVASVTAAAGAFPAEWGTFGGTHTWRGYRLLTMSVYPVRRVETEDGAALEFLDEYAVRVEYAPATDLADVARRERKVPGEAAGNEAVLRDLVANPGLLKTYDRDHGVDVAEATDGFQPDKTPSLTGSAVQYLIITNADMETEFQVLADHKTSQGIPTVVVTREFIAANFRNGADIQETIRMFIRDAYEKWGLEYVLLGGDSDILPPRYVKNSFYPTNGYTTIPVDLYFACLDGNWNGNNNSEYGEPASTPDPGDDVDFAEEVYIGRATVSTPAGATVFVNKIITYEGTAAGATWTNRALFAAEVLFPSDFHIEGYIILDGAKFAHAQVNNYIVPCTDMEYTRLYETDLENPWDAPLTRTALIDSLNTGHYGIFNQIGHGYYFNMSVADANFMTTDADALTNGDHLFMMYALNCASAAFDNSCLMERFVQNPNGGSICSIGSVRAAFPNNANNYQQLFFQALYCTSERRVGTLIAISRLPFLSLTTTNYVDRWTFENYTLLGDPTLAIWTGSPAELAVAAPTGLDLGPQTVSLTITDDGLPVADAEVCLEKSGEDHVFGVTDGAGQIDLDFLPVSTGTARVTVTGRNLALTTLDLPVTSGSSYLALDSMPLADDGQDGSSGNGDGFIDAGETIALSPVLLETGGSGANGISGVLTTADAGVNILNGSTTFQSVSAGGTTAAKSAMLVAFDAGLADGTSITFQLDVDSGSETYRSKWTVVVRAPELEVVDMDWDDVVFGNGSGLIDSGEQVNIVVDLKNFGVGTSGPLTGHLRTTSANVTLVDTTATWNSLGLLETAIQTSPFSVIVIDMLVNTRAYVVIEDTYGRTWRHDFVLRRPMAPMEIVTDTSLGADVIALSWVPLGAGDIYGYNVYRSQSPIGPFARVNTDVIGGTSYYRDEGLEQLTQYYYQVAAVDTSRVPSPPSATISQSTAPPEGLNFPVSFANETSSPLAVGDVDGDGDDEIVLASTQVYVWHHDGLELLDGDGDSQTLGNFTDFELGTVLQPAAVTLADLDGVPGEEMIISERDPGEYIHIFKKDGSEMAGWPHNLGGLAGSKWNWAAPAVGDIDGDGDPEIVVNTLNGVVWAWHHDGTEVRDGDANAATDGVFLDRAGADYEWSRSGPSLSDLDGDGAKDIIFGTKNDASGLRRVMALRYDGTDVAGFPYVANGPIDCDIAVGDLDNDFHVELVFYDRFKNLYAVRNDGSNYPGFPKWTGYTSTNAWVTSPALADMDGDGQLEIVYAPNEDGLTSRLIVVDTDYAGGTSGNVMAGWPVVLPGSSEASPVVGDIDGDAVPEILHGIGGGDESAPYNLYAYHANGTSVAGFPITLTGPLMNGVVITDLDRDLDVDIVYGGWDFLLHVWDMPFAYDRTAVPWPTYKGNNYRDGVIVKLGVMDVGDDVTVPNAALLVERPYPNPFNPSTTIRLYASGIGTIELVVYDLQGRAVRTLHTGAMAAGWHTLVWDGRDNEGHGQASGMYFLRAKGTDVHSVQKMTLLK